MGVVCKASSTIGSEKSKVKTKKWCSIKVLTVDTDSNELYFWVLTLPAGSQVLTFDFSS